MATCAEVPPKPAIGISSIRFSASHSLSSTSLPPNSSVDLLSPMSQSSQSAPQSPLGNLRLDHSDAIATPVSGCDAVVATSIDSSAASSAPLSGSSSSSNTSARNVPETKAVLRQHGGPLSNKNSTLVIKTSEEPPADPVTCEVKPGKETTIEVNKDKLGLGLSIVGGSDTLLVSNHFSL